MADALVGIIMGSESDWETMRHAAGTLEALDVGHEVKIVSAHRTPDRLYEFPRGREPRAETDHRRAVGQRICLEWRHR